MNTADIIILVLLFLWGAVAIRFMFRRKKCGGCQGCNGNCRSSSCPNSHDKTRKPTTKEQKEKNGT